MAEILATKEAYRKQELPRGAYSKIARRCRPTVTPQAVRLVALGLSKSARIERAIARYVEQLEKESAA